MAPGVFNAGEPAAGWLRFAPSEGLGSLRACWSAPTRRAAACW
jgi:hypothetical protein